MEYHVMTATPDDTATLTVLIAALSVESTYMMYEPGESPTQSAMTNRLAFGNQPELFLLVKTGSDAVAYAALAGSKLSRQKGILTLVIGVHYQHRRMGVGFH